MAFSKPIGYIPGSAIRRGRTQRQMEKAGELRRHFIDILALHLEKFVRESYFDGIGSPEQRISEMRENTKSMRDYFESKDGAVECAAMKDDEDEIGLFDALKELAKASQSQSDEEILKDLADADEEIIGEYMTTCADWIWQMMINTCHRLWKKGGPQSIGIKEFVDGLDLEKILFSAISEKYYPELRGILVSLMPVLFKESHMDHAKNGYMEVAYLESSGQIVLREVSWEMLQTWANS